MAEVPSSYREGLAESIPAGEKRWPPDFFDREENILKELEQTPSEGHKVIALEAIKHRQWLVVTDHIEKFKNLDEEVFDALLKNTHYRLDFDSTLLSHFKGLGKKTAEAILASDSYSAIISFKNTLEHFSGLDAAVAAKLIRRGFGEEVIDSAPIFSGLSKEIFLLLSQKNFRILARKKRWDEIEPNFMESQALQKLTTKLECFKELDTECAEIFVRMAGVEQFLEAINHFTVEADFGKKLFQEKLAELREVDAEIRNDGKIPTDPEQVDYETGRDDTDYTPDDVDAVMEMTFGSQLEKAEEHARQVSQDCLAINDHYRNKIDPLFKELAEQNNGRINVNVYDIYRRLLSGKSSSETRELGVTTTGEVGKRELDAARIKIRQRFLAGDESPDLMDGIYNNEIIREDVMALTRFKAAEFGRHDQEGFLDIVNRYKNRKPETRGVPTYLEASPVLKVTKVSREFNLTTDFRTRYTQLLTSLKAARDAHRLQGEAGLTSIIERTTAHMEKLRKKLASDEQRFSTEPGNHEGALGDIRRRMELLDTESFKAHPPQEQFNVLKSFGKEFDEELRELGFFLGYHINPQYLEKDIDSFSPTEPTIDDVSWVINFVDHIVHQETLRKYFTDKKAANNLRRLTKVSALEQSLKRLKTSITGQTMDLQFRPSRGLLAEFSGHMADTCWADDVDDEDASKLSMAEEHPNFTTLNMVKNPGTDSEAPAGAALLIETENDDERFLVIRGLNPLETVINQLDAAHFVQQLRDYLKPLAAKDGRKLVIVIDDHSGGAATNRPVLHAHLEMLRNSLVQVVLEKIVETSFNNHDITFDCYRL